LPSEPEGIPAAIDAAITGPADKDRACMKALFVPEARMMIVSLGADGAPGYTLLSLDDWIDGLRGAALTDGLAQELDARIVRSGQSTL
jgi:hypothetical protein